MPGALDPRRRDLLLAAFREEQPSPERPRRAYVTAGRAAGCDWRVARRAWLQGWPGVEALSAVVGREQTLARAALGRQALAAQLADTTTAASQDAVAQRAGQALVARGALGLAGSLLGELLNVSGPLVRRAVARIASSAPDPAEARSQLREVVAAGTAVVTLAEKAVQLERLALGEPTSIVGIAAMHPGAEPSLDEVRTELAAAHRALQLAQEDGATTTSEEAPSAADPAA